MGKKSLINDPKAMLIYELTQVYNEIPLSDTNMKFRKKLGNIITDLKQHSLWH